MQVEIVNRGWTAWERARKLAKEIGNSSQPTGLLAEIANCLAHAMHRLFIDYAIGNPLLPSLQRVSNEGFSLKRAVTTASSELRLDQQIQDLLRELQDFRNEDWHRDTQEIIARVSLPKVKDYYFAVSTLMQRMEKKGLVSGVWKTIAELDS